MRSVPRRQRPWAVLDNVGGLNFDFERVCSLQIIVRAENQLRAARARGDADLVEENRSFIDVDREDLPRTKEGDAATNVPSKWLHILERSHLGFTQPCGAGELFEVEFGVARHNGESVNIGPTGHEQGFEDLLWRHADLSGNRDRRQIVRVDLVFAKFEWDAERFEEASTVGFHRVGFPGAKSATRPACRRNTQSAIGAACSRWCVVITMVRFFCRNPASNSTI